MRNTKYIFFTGLLIAIIPFSGLPFSWKMGSVVVLGIIIMSISGWSFMQNSGEHHRLFRVGKKHEEHLEENGEEQE